MATFTPNYNLRKPAAADFVTVASDINANMDTLDTALDTVSDTVIAHAASFTSKFAHWNSVSTAAIVTATNTKINSNWSAVANDTSIVTQNAGDFTIQRNGLYLLNGSWTLNSTNATGSRTIFLFLNGGELRRQSTSSYISTVHCMNVSHMARLVVGDVVSLIINHAAGINQNLAASPGHDIQFMRVGD